MMKTACVISSAACALPVSPPGAVYHASFICTIPKVALGDGTTPAPGRPTIITR